MNQWCICHKSGRILFTTTDERTALNRAELGWRVEKVDQSREQFEESYSRVYKTPKHVLEKLRDGDTYRITDGDRVDVAWKMWKASREQMVVELPMRQAIYASGYGQGYMIDSVAGDALEYDEVIEALDKAGVKHNG